MIYSVILMIIGLIGIALSRRRRSLASLTGIDHVSSQLEGRIVDALTEDGAAHAETVISALGAIAGTSILIQNCQTLGDSGIAPGSAVIDSQVDEASIKILKFIPELCDKLRLPRPKLTDDKSVPEPHRPRRSALELSANFYAPSVDFLSNQGVRAEFVALLATIAALKVIKRFQNVLDPTIAMTIFLEAFISATKTKPLFSVA